MFTAFLIALLVVVGAATVVGTGLVLAQRRSLRSGPENLQLGSGTQQLLERGLGDLRVGDVIQYNGVDFIVEGVINYDEAGHRWVMGRIADGRDVRWLLVGLDRSTSPFLMTQVDDVDVNGYPPEALVRGDVHYRFDKRGTATTSLEGETGSLAVAQAGGAGTVHRCRWWNYSAAGPDCLLVEQWGDDYRVLVGKEVSSTELEMMPGS